MTGFDSVWDTLVHTMGAQWAFVGH